MIRQLTRGFRTSISQPRLLAWINIVGLAIALAATLIIVFYVQHETSYDKHWQGAERTYRLHNNFNLPGRAPYRLATTSSLLVPVMKKTFADEIEVAARARSLNITYRVGTETWKDLVVAVDPQFNELFPLDELAGTVQDTLVDTAGIALREDLALRLFGTTDVIDRTLTIEHQSSTVDYRVSAVYRMPANNSVLALPAIIRFDETLEPRLPGAMLGTWNQAPVASYLRLKPGISAAAIRSRLDEISDNNVDVSAMSPAPDSKPSDRLFFDMSPLSDLHLDSNFQNVSTAGNRVAVQAFSLIAALILVIACINFVYLTLAKSDRHAAEVGIRKILGAGKRQLLLQYLASSFLQVGMALLLGLALVELLLPLLANVLGIALQVDYRSAGTYLNLAGVYLLVALLAGLYPALMLSNFRPALVLRSRSSQQANGLARFRNLLLIFQFAVAIALIVATSVIALQIEFISRLDPGFTQQNLLFLTDLYGRPAVNASKELLKQRIAALPGVSEVSLASYHPMSTTTAARVSSAHKLEGSGDETFILANTFIDENFLPAYGIDLVAGRNFSLDRDRPARPASAAVAAPDTGARSVIINEAAARFFGFSTADEALGKLINSNPSGAADNYSIIGVVADNQFYSLKAVTRPEIYSFNTIVADVLTLAYQGNTQELMGELQRVWRELMGDAVFTVSAIEPLLARQFAQERAQGQVFVLFSLLAIFIACLGLYGASAFSAERRRREIGIRKVMGAEIKQILKLLLWQFSRPVLLANLVAWPLVLWAMLNWLQRFPYQIDALLLVPLCILAGAIALSIAWLTVASSAWRVASTNPVLALRYE